MLTRLYAIRHGESEDNRVHRFSGWSQCGLTEKGEEDARGAGRLLRGIPFVKVYASDQKRAMETCRIALGGAAFEPVGLLREHNIGFLQGRMRADCLLEYGQVLKDALAQRDFRIFDGENFEMQFERVSRFMRRLEQENIDGDVAAFCHDGVVRCMLRYVLDQPLTPRHLEVENGSVAIFTWDGSTWRLRSWNQKAKAQTDEGGKQYVFDPV